MLQHFPAAQPLKLTMNHILEMFNKLNKIIGFITAIAVLLYFFVPANAYVLQGPHLLELMAQNIGTTGSLVVSQKLVLYDDSFPQGSIELKETLKYTFPEKYRSDIISQTSKRIHVVSNGISLTVLDGKTVADHETIFDRYKDIILYKSRSALLQQLACSGISTSVVSLGRFNGKPVYVLGAQYPDEAASQIWLNKETFRPFRWMINRNNTAGPMDRVEVRYYKWQKIRKLWYPMLIEFYQDDQMIRMIEVDQIKVVPGLSAGMFDIDRLKSTYPKDTQVVSEPHQSGELGELQKMIEEFKKIYE